MNGEMLSEMIKAATALTRGMKMAGLHKTEKISVQIDPFDGLGLECMFAKSNYITHSVHMDQNGPIKSQADGHIRYCEIAGVKFWWQLEMKRQLPNGDIIACYR